eukprot:gb/GECH01007072.1/.p1 GENE.gb/GECH01007072.1/~~gb/GECH01007072.1/.p1  ORF type:complete len:112 (+),score=21.54 gb/GECH01007072.1/:1-336(+)
MRHLQLPAPLSFSFDSPVLPNAVALGDVNGDGNMGLVAASVGGAVALFQGRSAEPVWRTTLPGTVSAVTMGRVAGWEWTVGNLSFTFHIFGSASILTYLISISLYLYMYIP